MRLQTVFFAHRVAESSRATFRPVQWLLRWQTLVFLAPLGLGVVLVGMLALGVGAEADVDGDADSHVDAEVPGLLELLGVGRVPLSIVLLTLSLLFGTAGLVTNAFVEPRLPSFFAAVSIPTALVFSFFATGRLSRLIARLAPTLETYSVRRRDLIGRTGHAIVELTAHDGFAQVKDHEGNVQQLRVRTTGETLPKGTTLVLIDFDEAGDWYLAEAFDPDSLPAPPTALGERS